MSNIYFTRLKANTDFEEIKKISRKLLETFVERENFSLGEEMPLKVHFGEAGNETYIKSENYDGIIDFLEEKNIKTEFVETTVLYGGHRNKKEVHLKTAKEHGFDRLPINIADGDYGEDFVDIEVNQKHFDKCKIAKGIAQYEQVIVLSHFKGHGLAGFGGAIKQLSMGYASKGGKLAMHMGVKPKIVKKKCVKCKLCMKACSENAIVINDQESYIDHEKCVGCGGCVAVCPQKAISLMSPKGLFQMLFKRNDFREKLIEYALAGQKNKNNIYMNFIMNVTAGCDCVGKKMKPLMDDIAILISSDPLAIDKASFDMVAQNGKKFKGHDQLVYAENIGLGSMQYELIEII